jgi:hypothetical protein
MLIKSVKTLHELVIKHWSYKSLAWGVAYATVFMKWEQEVPFKKADSWGRFQLLLDSHTLMDLFLYKTKLNHYIL